MKSVTSFFDSHIIRKDITRFAPTWAVYLIGGILVMLSSVSSSRPHYVAQNVTETLGFFSIINMIYAGLVAQLLFGDLFNARLCNALHAMPLRREQWFCSHIAAGLCFSVVPNAIGISLVMIQMQSYWYAGPVWLLGMTLEYLFFFALAVFSVFCTGNRFAMNAIYAILNAASMLALMFITSIYEPLLFGMEVSAEPFQLLCPVFQLCSFNNPNDFIIFRQLTPGEMARSFFGSDPYYVFAGFGEAWGYLWILTGISVALLVLALLMYRRRALETAGDFMAVRPLAPVFSLIYTLTIGVLFSAVGDLMIGDFSVFLAVGMIVGFFTGQMLLQRTVKVFKPKTFLKCGGILVLLLVSMGLVWLDPIGFSRYVPEPHKVAQVEVDLRYGADAPLVLTEEEDIQKITQMHRQLVDAGRVYDERDMITIYLDYSMKNGTSVSRFYQAPIGGSAYEVLKPLLSAPEHVLGYQNWDDYLSRVQTIRINNLSLHLPAEIRPLLHAIKKDCEAGLMVQNHRFHKDAFTADKDSIEQWINIFYLDESGNQWETDITVYADAVNTVSWLRKNYYS